MRISTIVGLSAFVLALFAATPSLAQKALTQKALAHKEGQQLVERKMVYACKSRDVLLKVLDLVHEKKLEAARERFQDVTDLWDKRHAQCFLTNIGRVRKVQLVKRYHSLPVDYKTVMDIVVLKVTYPNREVLYITLEKTRAGLISI